MYSSTTAPGIGAREQLIRAKGAIDGIEGSVAPRRIERLNGLFAYVPMKKPGEAR